MYTSESGCFQWLRRDVGKLFSEMRAMAVGGLVFTATEDSTPSQEHVGGNTPSVYSLTYQTSQHPLAGAQTQLFPGCFWPPPICPESCGRGKHLSEPSPWFCWSLQCSWNPCQRKSPTLLRPTTHSHTLGCCQQTGWSLVSLLLPLGDWFCSPDCWRPHSFVTLPLKGI